MQSTLIGTLYGLHIRQEGGQKPIITDCKI